MKHQPLPYRLRPKGGEKAHYYRDSEKIADEILSQLPSFLPFLKAFQDFLTHNGLEQLRSDEEYFLELLTFGVYMENYGPETLSIAPFWQKKLVWLAKVRQTPLWKPLADLVKGLLLGLCVKRIKNPPARLQNFNTLPARLLGNLEALGDFGGTVTRLRRWVEFFSRLRDEERGNLFPKLSELTRAFRSKGQEWLGKYTVQVSSSNQINARVHRFQENAFFTTRPEVEYHLQMAGAEILNRCYAKDFQNRPQKAAALPSCLSLLREKCPAVPGELGLKCVHCSKPCQVSALSAEAEKAGAAVWIIPHESALFDQNASRGQIRDTLGLVGVACVLNLLEGGWKVREMGIPAQCVYLEQCGCQKHWGQNSPSSLDQTRTLQYLTTKG